MQDEGTLDERLHELVERTRSVERRMTSLERSMFGFHDDERNAWVPGILQSLSEMKKLMLWFVRLCWIIAPALLALVAHQYGVVDLLGKFLESFH